MGMQDTKSMINDALEDVNAKNEKRCRIKVRNLVEAILEEENDIEASKKEIVRLKAELKKLQAPEEVKLEI